MPTFDHRRATTSCSTDGRTGSSPGPLHYFRVHPDQWADRIRKARLMGLNTIETYVAWNAHAPRRGEFDTDGRPRPRPLPRPGRRRGHARDRAARPVHLRRVGQRRAAGLAARATPRCGTAPLASRATSPRSREYLEQRLRDRRAAARSTAADRSSSCRSRTSTAPTATTRPTWPSSCSSPAMPASPCRSPPSTSRSRDARRRQPARAAPHRLVRIARRRAPRHAARAPAHRAAHVRGVLGRLVRPLGRAPPHHRRGAVRRRARRAPRRRRIGEHLHVPRRHELRPHQRRERQGRLPADRDLLRLRRPARRGRATRPRSTSRSAT